jgi:hypothetical protein
MSPDKQLDSGIDHEKEKLRQALGDEADDISVLGYGVMYTVGADWNCIVPRKWLLDRINDLGIPRWLAPTETAPHYAFDRAIKWMREDWLETYYVEAPRLDNGVEEDHEIRVNLKEGDGSRVWHVYAEVFFDEEESKVEGGKWVQHHLGRLAYDKNSQYVRSTIDDELEEEHHLMEVWEDVSDGLEELFKTMENSHIAQDIRKMMYSTVTKYTNNVVKLRRSVYLFPAGMGEFVESMATLYAEIDEKWKDTGEPVAVRTFEVLDTDDKQEWVQHQVENTLEDSIDDILESAFAQFDEGEAADQVVKIIRQKMDQSMETAETYNALLEAEIDIEETLEQEKQEIADAEKQEIVEKVMQQTDLDEF